MECYVLKRDDFLAVLNEHPEIALGILLVVGDMVRRADDWIAEILDKLTIRNV